MKNKNQLSDEYWKQILTNEVYNITRRGGTERPFSGRYNDNKELGVYHCICCKEKLFDSKSKYDSKSGWPSFTKPINNLSIKEIQDNSHYMTRTETKCMNCDSHLGHVFPDGPFETGLRYCINSLSLEFRPIKKK